MRSVIAFVLLGLLTYAGAVFLFSGISRGFADGGAPFPFEDISPENYHDNLKVDAEIFQTVGELSATRSIPNKFFGVEIGDPIITHYYIIPVGDIKNDLAEQKYMLLCASSKEDLALLDELKTGLPLKDTSGRSAIKFTGIITEMNHELRQELQTFLAYKNDLITTYGLGAPDVAYADRHIIPYTLYIRRSSGGSLPAIIAGAAMTVIGLGGIILLLIKKHREKSGY